MLFWRTFFFLGMVYNVALSVSAKKAEKKPKTRLTGNHAEDLILKERSSNYGISGVTSSLQQNNNPNPGIKIIADFLEVEGTKVDNDTNTASTRTTISRLSDYRCNQCCLRIIVHMHNTTSVPSRRAPINVYNKNKSKNKNKDKNKNNDKDKNKNNDSDKKKEECVDDKKKMAKGRQKESYESLVNKAERELKEAETKLAKLNRQLNELSRRYHEKEKELKELNETLAMVSKKMKAAYISMKEATDQEIEEERKDEYDQEYANEGTKRCEKEEAKKQMDRKKHENLKAREKELQRRRKVSKMKERKMKRKQKDDEKKNTEINWEKLKWKCVELIVGLLIPEAKELVIRFGSTIAGFLQGVWSDLNNAGEAFSL